MDKNTFIKFVDAYTETDESVLGDLLNTVTTKFNRMVEREKNRRDSAHLKAASDMLGHIYYSTIYKKKNPKLFDNETCCALLDAMSEVYPNVVGGSVAGKTLLEHYAKSAKALGWEPEDAFILKVRGKSEWLRKLYMHHHEPGN